LKNEKKTIIKTLIVCATAKCHSQVRVESPTPTATATRSPESEVVNCPIGEEPVLWTANIVGSHCSRHIPHPLFSNSSSPNSISPSPFLSYIQSKQPKWRSGRWQQRQLPSLGARRLFFFFSTVAGCIFGNCVQQTAECLSLILSLSLTVCQFTTQNRHLTQQSSMWQVGNVAMWQAGNPEQQPALIICIQARNQFVYFTHSTSS